jgi:hypothetical protein
MDGHDVIVHTGCQFGAEPPCLLSLVAHHPDERNQMSSEGLAPIRIEDWGTGGRLKMVRELARRVGLLPGYDPCRHLFSCASGAGARQRLGHPASFITLKRPVTYPLSFLAMRSPLAESQWQKTMCPTISAQAAQRRRAAFNLLSPSSASPPPVSH